MWIAKNSITGKTYGDKYDSIYSCQSFIDQELILLEYQMRLAFVLEEDVLNRLSNKNKSFFDILNDAVVSFGEESGLKEDLHAICEMTLQGKKQSAIDNELFRLSCLRWQKNNIIRCYNVSQKRFADGFDF